MGWGSGTGTGGRAGGAGTWGGAGQGCGGRVGGRGEGRGSGGLWEDGKKVIWARQEGARVNDVFFRGVTFLIRADLIEE